MSNLFIQYISYAHILFFVLCFIFIEKLYRQKLKTILIFLSLSIVSVIIGISYSTLDLLILFVLAFIFSYKFFPDKKPMEIILSIMCSAGIEILFIPINLILLSFFSQNRYVVWKNAILFSGIIFSWIMCIILSILIRDKLYPYLKRKGKLELISSILMLIILSYQTIEMIRDYAENQNLFFMLLIFYFLLSSLIVMIIRSLTQKAMLEAEAKNNKTISDLQMRYVDEVKKQYQEIRKFRHDYTNLLSSVSYYLEKNKIEELKEYFSNDIVQTNAVLKKNNLILDALQNIESLGIRSIFYTKLLLAQEKNIRVQVEIRDIVPDVKKVDTVSLVRIFGIFLDNAIEELETIKRGSLIIVAFREQGDPIYIIQNTTRHDIEPLQHLIVEGFSTKGNGRGLGLSNVKDILLKEPHVLLTTEIVDDLFVQRVTILNEVN